MPKAISIGVGADTKDFSKGIKSGVIGPLEDVEKVFEDVAKAGDKATDKLEDGFKDAQRETKELTEDYKILGKIIDKESREAGKAIGKGFKDGTDDGREGLKDLKQEAGQTARESAASISSVEDAGGALQETLANAFSGFGPAGAAAGIAAAVGLGLVLEQINKQKEAAEELKQGFRDAYIVAAEEGRNYLSTAQVIERSLEILRDPGKNKQAEEDAKKIGVDTLTFIQAMAGDQEKLNAVVQAGVEAEKERRDVVSESVGIQGSRAQLTDTELDGIEKVNQKLAETKGIISDNQAAGENAVRIIKEQETAESKRVAAGIAGIDAQGARLKAYGEQLAGIKPPVIKPTLDTTGIDQALNTWLAKRRNAEVNLSLSANGRAVLR